MMMLLAWMAQAGLSLGDMTSCGEMVSCYGPRPDPLTCSPWPGKRTVHPNATNSPRMCDTKQIQNFAGGDGKAMAWVDNSQHAANRNFWVFHGCDGAGLRMTDCLGDSLYVEQLGPSTMPPLPVPDFCYEGSDPWCTHKRTAFMHPGLGRSYEWLNAGQWTVGEKGGRWPDQLAKKSWWKNMGLDSIDHFGTWPEGEVAYVIMFPWVAEYTPLEDWSWFWSSPQQPYGLATTKYVKAHYDNEPWNNDHTTVPPVWQAFKFWKDNDAQQIHGWMVGEKTADKADPVIYNKTKVFKLDWVTPEQAKKAGVIYGVVPW
jgi:hypothetical protein